MSELEHKLKTAFHLSDLIFLRQKDKIMPELSENLRKISNDYERRGLTNSGFPIAKRDEKREEIINKLINLRVHTDLQEVDKITEIITEDISEKIYKRAQEIVTNPVEKYGFEKADNEEELKSRLLFNIKRDIEIFRMQTEIKDYSKKRKFIDKGIKVFLSYSHYDINIADEVDISFKSKGILLTRDERDAPEYSDLEAFMDTVRDHDYVIMLVSDHYLKSINCMYEVIQFIKEKNYSDRTFPITIDNEIKIFDRKKHIKYVDYWQKEYISFESKIKKLRTNGMLSSHKELNKIGMIRSNIGDFLRNVSFLKCVSLQKLKESKFKAIIDKIERSSDLIPKEDSKVNLEELKLRIISYLYKYYLKGLKKGIIPEFNWKKKEKEWEIDADAMSQAIDEMVDDGLIKYSSFGGNVDLTKEGKILARE